VGGGTDSCNVGGGDGGARFEEDYDAFPVVAVAETIGGFVFGEIPGGG
jgi:hypothetical protein